MSEPPPSGPSIDVVTEGDIDRPRDEVAAFSAEPSNAPEWYANIEAVEGRTEPLLAGRGRGRYTFLVAARSPAVLVRACVLPSARPLT